jgi:hypothetical protein
MQRRANTFDLTLENIPLLNLRMEFRDYWCLLQKPEFRELFGGTFKVIRVPDFDWRSNPDDLLTLIIQRSILGLESYLPAAVYFNLGQRDRLDRNALETIRNYYSLPGNGVADKLYNSLPALVEEQFALKLCDEILWNRTNIFYKEIRHPIFHGYRVDDPGAVKTLEIMEFLRALHLWIDTWFSPNEMLPNSGSK